MPGPAVKVVTTISSKLEREREDAAGEECRSHERERHVAERLDPVGAEVGGGLEQIGRHPAQTGDDVVVREDHTERRVGDHQRMEAEPDLEVEQAHVDASAERVLQRHCR